MENFKKYLIDILSDKSGKINAKKLKYHLSISHELLYNINKFTPNCNDKPIIKVYWILTNRTEYPTCKICNTRITRCNMTNSELVYKKYCSTKCAGRSEDRNLNIKQTKLERYGDENYTNIDKRKISCIEKYGYEHPIQNEDIAKAHSKTLKNKTTSEWEDRNLKTKQTKLERYGDENYFNTEKSKKTCLEKYGNENYLNTIEGI